MASGGSKRTRSERVAALEMPPSPWERIWKTARRGDVLLRMGFLLLTALALGVVIGGWQPPFSYRTGYTPPRDVVSRVAFQVESEADTKLARERAVRQVPYVYRNDPEPLARLCDRLRNTVIQVTAAESYDDLPQELWADFLPPAERLPDQSEQAIRNRFDTFRASVDDSDGLTRFSQAVTKALEPFEQRGLLTALKFDLGDGNQDEIVVYRGEDPSQGQLVKVRDVLIGNGAAIRESLRRELRSTEVGDRVFDWIWPKLPETLFLDEPATLKAQELASSRVEPAVRQYEVGQTLVKAGVPLSLVDVELLRVERDAANAERSIAARLIRFVAVVLVVLALFALAAAYLNYHEPQLLGDTKRLGQVMLLAVLTLGLAIWAASDAFRAEIIPLLLFGQMIAIAIRRELALLLSGVVTLILVMGLGLGMGEFVVLMGVLTTVILQLGRVRNRTKLIYVGLLGGVAAFLLTLGAGVLDDQAVARPLLVDSGRNALWTLAAGFLMTGLLPFVEKFFGVLTDMNLLELGDVSHPLLQELIRRAPSTYNHSLTVGSIAEAAAEAIGGRGLLVRVGAYFHDIGKMLKPTYFIENQPPDDNLHATLMPRMSTLVIIAHVKDGANLARQHKLPEPIIDLLEQHHGTTLVQYFYGRAVEQLQQEDPDGETPEESTFRYPGPKPQTKEAGVLMLADAAESACRSLVEPSSARIEGMVRRVAEDKLEDGQFDESGLTLKELRTIEDSVIKSLIANYHGRVKYPDQQRSA